MEKLIAYKMSVSEAEEILQNVLDDAGIRLVSDLTRLSGVWQSFRRKI